MKAELESRLENLEAIVRRWKVDNKVYESFNQHNNEVNVCTFTQKVGQKRGKPIVFETPRKALDWVKAQLGRGGAEIILDDIRDVMPPEEVLMFDFLFPDAPDYHVFFDLRNGQDVSAVAAWHWRRRTLAGVRYNDWWAATNARIDELLPAPSENTSQDAPG